MKNTVAMLLLCLAALPVAAQPASGPYKVTDVLDRTVSFDGIPERIVVGGKAALLLVDAVYLFPGAGSRVAGVGLTDQGIGDVFPLLDANASGKARFPNDAGPEQIASIRPDLVVLKSYMKSKLGDALERLGIAVLYLDLETPAAFARDIRCLGALFRDPDRAEEVIRFYGSRRDGVAERTERARRPSVLLVSYTERDGDAAVGVAPDGWVQTSMVEAAGGLPVWKGANTGQAWLKVGIEQIAVWDPEYILVVSYQTPSADAAERLRASPRWKALRAASSGRILPFPADFLSWDQSDVRWILGLQWTASALHGDLFPDLDMGREVAAFYGTLYGLPASVVASAVMPRLARTLAAGAR